VSTTGSERRADVVQLAGELFAQKGYRATTVREIADAAGILSGSLYHHFDSKESIGDEILSGFINEVLADYRAAVAEATDPRVALEQIVRTSHSHLASARWTLAALGSSVTVSTVFLVAPFQSVSLNENPILFIKSLLSVMLFLPGNILGDSIDIRMRN